MQKFFLCICIFLTTQSFSQEEIIPLPDHQERLEQLKISVAKELDVLKYPSRPWLQAKYTSTGEPIYDVVIIGGGQTGMTIAFALRREKIDNVILFDENEEGSEGPWLTYAHMEALRSPKDITGPDCGIPSLTCQYWFEAKYGSEEWMKFHSVPRKIWAEYLQWLREMLDLPIVNQTKVGSLVWEEKEQCFLVPLQTRGESKVVYARKIVLATGLQGSGEWSCPTCISKNLSKDLYCSAYEEIDFTKVQDKKVGILGGGPCAFDNAILCHEHGAREIHLFFKRAQLVNIDAFKWGTFAGFLNHFSDLSDEDKWKFVLTIHEIGSPPTPDPVAKVKKMENVFLHFESPWFTTESRGDKAVVFTPQGEHYFDFLLVATGWAVNLSIRKELKNCCEHIALWADRFTPPEHQQCPPLLQMPYLGPHFTFTEKHPGNAPYINSIFNCTGAAMLSNGINIGTGLIGMKYSLQKIVYGIVSQLFVEDKDYYHDSLEHYDEQLFEN